MSTTTRWDRVEAGFVDSPPAPIGLIVLATDRASGADIPAFLPPSAEAFVSRIAMAPVVTPESLAALGDGIVAATELLVPAGPLAAIGFACTSGTAAVGVDVVHERIGRVRPGVPVSTPLQAGVAALGRLGAKRIALLTPYHDAPSRMIESFFEASGVDVVARASFKLDGDPDMNRVSPASLIDEGLHLGDDRAADALFISCTGLRTRHVVDELERRLGKPVVTSNQALAWELARLAGLTERVDGCGRLLREF